MALSTNYPFNVVPLAGNLGARIEGLDLAVPMSESTFDSLKNAFTEFSVLVIPGQGHITVADHVAFGERWGKPMMAPMNAPVAAGNPAVMNIHTEAGAYPQTDMWHSDLSFLEMPPSASILLARHIPGAGGDTTWASCYRAYDSLSPKLQEILRTLKVRHSGAAFAEGVPGEDPESAPKCAHPAVRLIPENGRRALYVNRKFTVGFDGLTDAESGPLLEWLCSNGTQLNFTFRHRWTQGDVVMWDNRCVNHYAIWDYREERTMHRVTIEGEQPLAG